MNKRNKKQQKHANRKFSMALRGGKLGHAVRRMREANMTPKPTIDDLIDICRPYVNPTPLAPLVEAIIDGAPIDGLGTPLGPRRPVEKRMTEAEAEAWLKANRKPLKL